VSIAIVVRVFAPDLEVSGAHGCGTGFKVSWRNCSQGVESNGMAAVVQVLDQEETDAGSFTRAEANLT